MKIVIFFACLVVLASCRPQSGKDATIVRFENDNNIDSYKFAYETSDGTKREEEGTPKDLGGDEGPAIVMRGSYTFKDEATGQVYTVTYIADENGFQPTGDHIPKI